MTNPSHSDTNAQQIPDDYSENKVSTIKLLETIEKSSNEEIVMAMK